MSLVEDALGQILDDESVKSYINNNKELLRQVFHSLVDAYRTLFPNGPLRLKILGPLMWGIVRWESKVRNVFLLHSALDPKELQSYGGLVCEKICEEILKVIEMDLEDIKLKRV